MSTIDLGAPVTVIWAGAPHDGTISVAVTRPDGTTFPTPSVSSQPPITSTFTPDMAGRWLIRWASVTPAGAYSDIVDVWPVDPRFIISLDDAKAALNMTTMDNAQLDDLRLYIAAATPVIEDIVGVVVPRTVVQKSDGGMSSVILWETPVSVQSVTENGSAITDYWLDTQAGIIYGGTATSGRKFATGRGGVVVTYTAGYQVIPANIRLATRELVRHWWQVGKQAMRQGPVNTTAHMDVWTPSGYAVPRRVMELCQSSRQMLGGFA
jgi:hypothetical protein